MAQLNITLDTELLHELFTKDSRDQAFSKLLETILNQVLMAQSTEQLGAEPYERSVKTVLLTVTALENAT